MRDLTATLYPVSGILHNFARDAGMGKQTIFVIAMTEVLDAGSPALVLDPISFVGYSKEVLL